MPPFSQIMTEVFLWKPTTYYMVEFGATINWRKFTNRWGMTKSVMCCGPGLRREFSMCFSFQMVFLMEQRFFISRFEWRSWPSSGSSNCSFGGRLPKDYNSNTQSWRKEFRCEHSIVYDLASSFRKIKKLIRKRIRYLLTKNLWGRKMWLNLLPFDWIVLQNPRWCTMLMQHSGRKVNCHFLKVQRTYYDLDYNDDLHVFEWWGKTLFELQSRWLQAYLAIITWMSLIRRDLRNRELGGLTEMVGNSMKQRKSMFLLRSIPDGSAISMYIGSGWKKHKIAYSSKGKLIRSKKSRITGLHGLFSNYSRPVMWTLKIEAKWKEIKFRDNASLNTYFSCCRFGRKVWVFLTFPQQSMGLRLIGYLDQRAEGFWSKLRNIRCWMYVLWWSRITKCDEFLVWSRVIFGIWLWWQKEYL